MTVAVICIGVLTILSIPCNDRVERLLKHCNKSKPVGEKNPGDTKILPEAAGGGEVGGDAYAIRNWNARLSKAQQRDKGRAGAAEEQNRERVH